MHCRGTSSPGKRVRQTVDSIKSRWRARKASPLNSFSRFGLLVILCSLGTGCLDSSAGSGGRPGQVSQQVQVCHGYSCKYKTSLVLGTPDLKRLAAILAAGKQSAQAERKAIARAVAYFEQRTFDVIGIRDEPRSKFGASGVRGQMDCIDESTNTRRLLLYLADRKFLRHHTVGMNASRGLLVDGRYFHSTAVIRDAGGEEWAVDSWYATMGGSPDILPLRDWRPRGFLSSGALPKI